MIQSLIPTPDIFSARRILCVQPHYDDNDIAAAGILKRLQQKGAQVFYLTVTDDLMGVVDGALSPEAAAAALKRDQLAAGQIIGVVEQYWLGYPDADQYDYFALRRDLLRHLRLLQPDFVFAPNPWLTYEGHRDHIQTGLATTEAVMFAGLKKIASSDPAVDSAYQGHEIQGMVYYYTREPNYIADITPTWEAKIAAVRCYQAQFEPEAMERLVMVLEMKSRQVAAGTAFERGEPLNVLHPSALHCGV
ncbi:MAG TPA: PIG-L deacetylase family protein [Anaerolineales bacterium]|nr:PIG-L deacetylase family protein [Anaerolineales bacterium]